MAKTTEKQTENYEKFRLSLLYRLLLFYDLRYQAVVWKPTVELLFVCIYRWEQLSLMLLSFLFFFFGVVLACYENYMPRCCPNWLVKMSPRYFSRHRAEANKNPKLSFHEVSHPKQVRPDMPYDFISTFNHYYSYYYATNTISWHSAVGCLLATIRRFW